MADQIVTVVWDQAGVRRKGSVRVPDGNDPETYVKVFTAAANQRLPPSLGPLTIISIETNA